VPESSRAQFGTLRVEHRECAAQCGDAAHHMVDGIADD
jgi:hypothetical protein